MLASASKGCHPPLAPGEVDYRAQSQAQLVAEVSSLPLTISALCADYVRDGTLCSDDEKHTYCVHTTKWTQPAVEQSCACSRVLRCSDIPQQCPHCKWWLCHACWQDEYKAHRDICRLWGMKCGVCSTQLLWSREPVPCGKSKCSFYACRTCDSRAHKDRCEYGFRTCDTCHQPLVKSLSPAECSGCKTWGTVKLAT